MRIIKIAQSDSEIRSLRKCLQAIFATLATQFNSAPVWDATYILNVSIEKHDEADPAGESWIQVAHSRDNVHYSEGFSTLHVERYFENELAQQEYGKTVKVQFDWENQAEAISKVLDAVKSI